MRTSEKAEGRRQKLKKAKRLRYSISHIKVVSLRSG